MSKLETKKARDNENKEERMKIITQEAPQVWRANNTNKSSTRQNTFLSRRYVHIAVYNWKYVTNSTNFNNRCIQNKTSYANYESIEDSKF